jgi:preprotein translocase subunit SecG
MLTTAQVIVNVLMVAAAIVLIVSVLLQKGDAEGGMGAIMGGSGAESFFGKNKSKTLQGKLAALTKASAGVFIALAIVMMFLM